MFNEKSRIGIIGSLLLSMAFVLASGCTKKESNEMVLGVTGPFSGGTSPLGLSFRNGVQMAVDEINAKGGILGKKITTVVRDDEAKNEKGAQIAQELLDKEKVFAIIGPVNTGVADAATKYANLRKVPQFISVSAGPKVNEHFADFPDSNYIFRFAVSDDIQSAVIVRETVEVRKFKRPAIICDDTNFGQAGRERLEKHLKKYKVRPVYVGKFKIKDTDMTPQLQGAKAANADVVLVYALGPEAASLANSMEKMGWKKPILGAWTLSMPNFINNAKSNAEGASMPMSFIESSQTGEPQLAFLKAYYAKFNEKPIPSALSAVQSYDVVYLLKQAIEQAGSFEGPKVKAALEDLATPFQGITGVYTKPYSATDHEAMKEEHLSVGIIKDGIVIKK